MSREGNLRNVAASVRARLKNVSRDTGEEFELVLRRYGLERVLYRLSQSEHRESFILKGAVLFVVWSPRPHRPTRDLDLLGRLEADADQLAEIFRHLCRMAEADGLEFPEDAVRTQNLREEEEYGGVRVLFKARLQNIVIPIQIDVGFGDAVTPRPQQIHFPTLLPDFPAPRLRAYTRETVVAEKLHAMVMNDMGNSRMKDFFDVWTLCREFAFEGATLAAAIRATFQRRATALPEATPVALTDAFSQDASRRTQWNAFLRKGRLDAEGAALDEVVAALRRFLAPPLDALRTGTAFDEHWPAGGPWSP
jgi:predicted nucleotidyltransferase component of viral defense system